MNYRKDKYGNDISILGFGCMRFPNKVGITDAKETEKEILCAIEHGVNYFDTAYIYPQSEVTLGEILERNNLRDRVYIATKLPHYLIKNKEKLDELFKEQLARLKTDRIDYYLMHMLTDCDTWERLCSLGIIEWIEEKKKAGSIGQIGFSYHGNSAEFIKLCDAFEWDFCQIQYNYLDEHSQAGRRGLQYANKKGLAVIIMEPLRGGRLVKNLPEKAQRLFSEYSKKGSPASWALRWLWDQPEVTSVLSGMNSMDMVLENIETASTTEQGSLSDKNKKLLSQVADALNEKIMVGCTGCAYCMPCPKNVDIPGTFAAYNRRHTESKFWGLVDYIICTGLRKNSTAASNCIDCGKCEKHCPQGIAIRKELKNAKKELESPLYKFVIKIVKLFKF
ncbi:MAG: aldo/keto reductase [Clostridia bacterium]|nr:aldo/keto reductase [Clostridia bacterium]